jgi:VWFA-related protein
MRWIVSLAVFAVCMTPLAAQEVVLHSGTSEILVDVVVHDKHGRPVHGLHQSDFQVFEDNAAQTVTSWREVRGGVSPDQATPTASEVFVQANRSENSALHLSRQVRLVSLVFDKLSDTGRKLARTGALDFLKRDAGPNAYYAIFFVDRSFKVIQTYTNNMDLLRAAVERATGLVRSVPNTEDGGLEVLGQQTAAAVGTAESLSNSGQGQPSVNGAALADEQANAFTDNMLQLSDQLNRTDLGQVSIFSLWAIIKQLERLPGRKSVLYFSEGYTMPNDLWMQFASLISAANRANVTLYAIDARGLSSSSDTNLAQGILSKGLAMSNHMTRSRNGGSAVGDFRAGDYELDSLRANGQMVLRELAESTGGELIANTNDFRPQLQHLSEDFNTWYELTYKTTNADYDGRFRAIGVALAGHPAYTVQARSGYFALPPMEGQFVFPYEVPLLRALSQQPLPRNLDFSAGIIPFRHLSNGMLQSSLVFDLPLKPVEFTRDEKSGQYITHLSVLSLVKDEHGNVVAKLSRDVSLGEAKEQLDAFRQGRFIVTLPVDLPPGRYTVESVAADQRGGRFGARRASFFAQPRHAGPEMSGLALLRRVEDPGKEPDPRDPLQIAAGRAVPTLSTHVPLGRNTLLSVFFKLYPDAASKERPRLVIDLLREGRIVSRSTPDLPASDDVGEIPYLANLPVGTLQAGQYEFRATLLQGNAADQKAIAVTLD